MSLQTRPTNGMYESSSRNFDLPRYGYSTINVPAGTPGLPPGARYIIYPEDVDTPPPGSSPAYQYADDGTPIKLEKRPAYHYEWKIHNDTTPYSGLSHIGGATLRTDTTHPGQQAQHQGYLGSIYGGPPAFIVPNDQPRSPSYSPISPTFQHAPLKPPSYSPPSPPQFHHPDQFMPYEQQFQPCGGSSPFHTLNQPLHPSTGFEDFGIKQESPDYEPPLPNSVLSTYQPLHPNLRCGYRGITQESLQYENPHQDSIPWTRPKNTETRHRETGNHQPGTFANRDHHQTDLEDPEAWPFFQDPPQVSTAQHSVTFPVSETLHNVPQHPATTLGSESSPTRQFGIWEDDTSDSTLKASTPKKQKTASVEDQENIPPVQRPRLRDESSNNETDSRIEDEESMQPKKRKAASVEDQENIPPVKRPRLREVSTDSETESDTEDEGMTPPPGDGYKLIDIVVRCKACKKEVKGKQWARHLETEYHKRAYGARKMRLQAILNRDLERASAANTENDDSAGPTSVSDNDQPRPSVEDEPGPSATSANNQPQPTTEEDLALSDSGYSEDSEDGASTESSVRAVVPHLFFDGNLSKFDVDNETEIPLDIHDDNELASEDPHCWDALDDTYEETMEDLLAEVFEPSSPQHNNNDDFDPDKEYPSLEWESDDEYDFDKTQSSVQPENNDGYISDLLHSTESATRPLRRTVLFPPSFPRRRQLQQMPNPNQHEERLERSCAAAERSLRRRLGKASQSPRGSARSRTPSTRGSSTASELDINEILGRTAGGRVPSRYPGRRERRMSARMAVKEEVEGGRVGVVDLTQ